MNVFYPDTILRKLDDELEKLKNQSIEKKMIAEKSIGLCQLAFLDLKTYVLQNGFKNEYEEINFFKTVKPKVFSNLIFFNELLKIETFKSLVNNKFMMKILKSEVRKIHDFIKNNREFYQYYLTHQTCLDDTYFMRNKSFVFINSKNFHYLTDPQFASLRDETVSYILAYEQYGKYLEDEIDLLRSSRKLRLTFQSGKLNSEMNWTAPKAALVELIYALHSSNCINNGRIDIKRLIKGFELIFDIKLDKSYRVFVDIKARQKEKAKFLTELKKALTNKLDDLDALN